MNNMYSCTDVTVLIATKDRVSDLHDTLVSFCQLNPKPQHIYVVDNSEENTAQYIFDTFYNLLPLRTFHQPIQGKSRCLNLLLSHLQTNVCFFTDDDVRVPEQWISCMLSRLNETGAIAVQGEIHLPDSYCNNHVTTKKRRALFEVRELEQQFATSPFLIGANMAIAWHRCSGLKFDECTGPGALGYMDDTLIALKLLDCNETIAYADCAVTHYFPVERIQTPTPLHDAIKHGRSTAYVEVIRSVPIRRTIILNLVVRLLRMALYMVLHCNDPKTYSLVFGEHSYAFFHYWYRIVYMFKLPRSRR
jgi:glycosyltransferase involved in cell wall biosynthesis